MPPENLPIFVYGTLKQGEERAPRWPRPPQRIVSAVTCGQLYDLGPYPALVPGEDRVLGELWFIAPEDIAVTLKVLDEIECFGNEDVDLYVRRITECTTHKGSTERAYVYYFANPDELARANRVRPDASGLCCWTANHERRT
jgi:gamma-glutamylcyclotransferase (GGCT)/AIG2-like uncharacterized protein YtfP